MGKFGGMFKKKSGSSELEVSPVLGDVEAPRAFPTSQSPGLLMQDAGPAATKAPAPAPAKKGKQAAVPPVPPAAAEEEQSTGLLSKMLGKKKKTTPDGEEEVELTLKQKFKSKKQYALAGILVSAMTLILALFSSNMIYKVLNATCGAAGVLAGLFYFFFITINHGVKIFFYSSILVVGLALGCAGYNVYWLVTNFTSLSTWFAVPYTIVLIAGIGTQAFLIGTLGYHGYKMVHGQKKAEDMARKAADFARQVG